MLALREITSSVMKSLPGKAAFRLRPGSQLVIASGINREQRHVFPYNITRSSLMKHIPNPETIDSQDLMFFGYMMYLFTLRLIYNRRIKKYSKLDKEIVDYGRDSIFASFDLVRYKIATMRCLIRRLDPASHLKEIGDVFEECGISREDRILYCLAYYNGDLDNFILMMGLTPDEAFVVDCETLRKEVNTFSFYKEVRNASSYFASRKLSFIARGNRFSVEDLRNDLMLRAVQAYYWVRPFYGQLHAVNYAKSAIKGWTGCLITHYTDASRERTRSDGAGGYENTVVEMTDDVVIQDGMLEDHLIHLIDIKRLLNKPLLSLEEIDYQHSYLA